MRTYILKTAAILLFLTGSISSCRKEKDIPENIPACIINKIQEIKDESVWNPPATIWQYHYNGQIVYYIPQRCCDIPSLLMDAQCDIICNPDGGLSGNGDGNCTDFFEKRKNEKLIWQDKRTYP
jgi:hypothetical protein